MEMSMKKHEQKLHEIKEESENVINESLHDSTKRTPLTVINDDLSKLPEQSPMSDLALKFNVFSSLSTPTTSKSDVKKDNKHDDDDEQKDLSTTTTSLENSETINKSINDDDKNDNGMITINSAGISPATRQREQHIRGMQRRMNIQPQVVNFNIKCDESPGKENVSEEDISFYATTDCPTASPSRHLCHVSNDDEMECLSPTATSPPIEIFSIGKDAICSNSHDSNSRDSGYIGLQQEIISNNRVIRNITSTITSSSSKSSSPMTSSAFKFLKPKCPSESLSPLHNNNHRTPSKQYSMSSGGSSRMANGFKVFNSLSLDSNESMDPDDEFMELMEMENMDEETQGPKDLTSLFSKDIQNSKTPESKRSTSSSFVRKRLDLEGSMNSSRGSLYFGNSPSTPKSSTITSLITTPERQHLSTLSENITPFSQRNVTKGAFKRPEPPTMSPIHSKRQKYEVDVLPSPPIVIPQTQRPILRKSHSMNDAAVIMNALSRSTTDPNLTGDFSRVLCLPIMDGNHSDLKSISSETMRQLLMGEFDDAIASFKIIDCRYPYEFEGGHIRGAINLYSQEQVLDELVNHKTDQPTVAPGEQKREILIFHCEFSSERGPRLSRFLRNHDRTNSPYPALHYPEIYLLHGGYKKFYELNSDLCDPIAYRQMNDAAYVSEYKHFRAKSKTWSGNAQAPGTVRLTKSRSRLLL